MFQELVCWLLRRFGVVAIVLPFERSWLEVPSLPVESKTMNHKERILRHEVLALLDLEAVPSSDQTELEVFHLLLLSLLDQCLIS